MNKICKFCSVELTEANRAGARLSCKKCRSKESIKFDKENNEKRKKRVNAWARKIGKVKQHPCITCKSLCYKKYAKAFCSDQCRFMSYVQVSEECWIWKGAINRGGYGKLCFRGNNTDLAHRVSYKLFKGDIEDNLLVCHTCDIRNCVSPKHLWLGTNQQNMMDMVDKDRQNSKLTHNDVFKIRELVEKFGVKQEKIVEQFKITSGTVSSIIHRRIWKHI